jgi:hypothetical protein
MYPKDQENFLKKIIKSGKYSRKEAMQVFDNKFKRKRKMSIDAIKNFTKTRGLKFPDSAPHAWSEKENKIYEGLWLVGANMKRKLIELPSRGLRSMEKKNARVKANGELNEATRKDIKSLIAAGIAPYKIAKKYGIPKKYIDEFAETVNAELVEFKNLKRWEKQDLDGIFEGLEDMQNKLRNLDSEQTSADVNIKTKSRYIALTVVSDFHLENINTDLGQLRSDFEIIRKTPNLYAGFNGDLIDNFAVGPHKEGVIEGALPPRQARMLAGKLFEHVKDKMLWMVLGCHDAWDKNYADYDLPQHIARKIGVPYLGHGGDINLKVNDIEYFIHSRHKYRGSGGLNNGTNCCKKVLQQIDPKFDIVSISHNHFSEIRLEHYLGKNRCYIRTGSYKREDRFSKMLGFRSNEFNIQIPVVILDTVKKEMKVVSGIDNGAEMLLALNSTASKESKKANVTSRQASKARKAIKSFKKLNKTKKKVTAKKKVAKKKVKKRK